MTMYMPGSLPSRTVGLLSDMHEHGNCNAQGWLATSSMTLINITSSFKFMQDVLVQYSLIWNLLFMMYEFS